MRRADGQGRIAAAVRHRRALGPSDGAGVGARHEWIERMRAGRRRPGCRSPTVNAPAGRRSRQQGARPWPFGRRTMLSRERIDRSRIGRGVRRSPPTATGASHGTSRLARSAARWLCPRERRAPARRGDIGHGKRRRQFASLGRRHRVRRRTNRGGRPARGRRAGWTCDSASAQAAAAGALASGDCAYRNIAMTATDAASAAPPAPSATSRRLARRCRRAGASRRDSDRVRHASRETCRQRCTPPAAHHVAAELPALPAAAQFVVVLEAAQQETRFVRRQFAVHQRRQLQAVVVEDPSTADRGRAGVSMSWSLGVIAWHAPWVRVRTVHEGPHFLVDRLAGAEDARTHRADRAIHPRRRSPRNSGRRLRAA